MAKVPVFTVLFYCHITAMKSFTITVFLQTLFPHEKGKGREGGKGKGNGRERKEGKGKEKERREEGRDLNAIANLILCYS